MHDFHRDTIVWLRYADPREVMGALESIFDENPVSWVAPIHGPPIAAEDLSDYMDTLENAVVRLSEAHQVRV